jgi:hypothetical protein
MENGKWKMEDGRWKMEDGRWKMEDGRWKMGRGKSGLNSVGLDLVCRDVVSEMELRVGA